MIENDLFEITRAKLARISISQTPRNSRLPVDRYLAASILQKAIRRAETALAVPAGQRLFELDQRYFWRRLLITLFEDVGVLDPVLALDAIAAAPRRGFQRLGWPVARHLIERLCSTPKSQIANHLLHLCIWDIEEKTAANEVLDLGFDDAVEWATNHKHSLVSRAAATWMLGGVAMFGRSIYQSHPKADLERLLSTELAARGSAADRLVLVHGLRLTQTPLPLLAVLFGQHSGLVETAADDFPDVDLVGGIPDWVFDQHTRVGKEAIRQWIYISEELGTWRRTNGLSRAETIRAVSSAHFEFEAALIRRRAQLESHLSLLKRVKALGAYRTPQNAPALYEALKQGWPIFSELRANLIKERLGMGGK